MVQLQEIVANDPKYRFHLIFDPTRGGESWWIRAKLWDVCDLYTSEDFIFIGNCTGSALCLPTCALIFRNEVRCV